MKIDTVQKLTLAFVLSLSFACGGRTISTSKGASTVEGDERDAPAAPTEDIGAASEVFLAGLEEACAGNATLRGDVLLAALQSPRTLTFVHASSGVSTRAVLSVAYLGGQISCRTWQSGGVGSAPDLPPQLNMPVRLALATDDGSLQESVSGTLSRRAGGNVEFSASEAARSKVGTIQLAPMPGFVVTLYIGGDVRCEGNNQVCTVQGNVMQQGSRPRSESPDETSDTMGGQVAPLGMLR